MPLDPLTGEDISGLPRLTVTPNDYPLPVEQPQFDPATGLPYPTNPQPDYSGVNPQLQSLFGLNGQDRYQLWPERMIRSGVSAPGDSYSGKLPVESPTGYPGSVEPSTVQMEVGPTKVPFTNLEIPSVLNAVGIKNFTVPGPESEIARAQDVAGMAGMSGIRMTPKNALGTTGSRKFTRAELEKMDTADLDRMAFGHATDDVVTLNPKDILIRYKDDLINPQDKFDKKGMDWINSVDLSKPVEVSLNHNGQFSLEDGHHRWFAANKLNVPIKAEITKIRGKPIEKLLGEDATFLEDTRAATGIGAINQSGFYSNLERTIANSKVQKATPDQWQAYLKNQPGVKPEELEFSLSGLGDGIVTKDQLAAHVADNGIKLGEVWKGARRPLDEAGKAELAALEKRFADKDMTLNHEDAANLAELRMHNQQQEQGTNPSKYSSYQLPGAENYRELLLTVPDTKGVNSPRYQEISKRLEEITNLPAKIHTGPEGTALQKEFDALLAEKAQIGNEALPQYKSSHWDEPNVLAHIRMNDREIPGVGKTLHIEEIQSDWHQAGRKQGYKQEVKPFEIIDNPDGKGFKIKRPDGTIVGADRDNRPYVTRQDAQWVIDAAVNHSGYSQTVGVPNAPFKKTWDELALKRVLTEAANGPYDAVSWTPGEAQAARYDLSKQVKNITWNQSNASNSQIVRIEPHTGDKINLQLNESGKIVSSHPSSQARQFEGKNLSDVVGKEMAEKILAEREGNLSGEGLKLGGEGMKAFYDTMLPAKANALIKKMGGKVEKSETINPKEMEAWKELNRNQSTEVGDKSLTTMPIWVIKITPQMREQIKSKGFPLYSAGVPTFTPSDDPNKPKLTPVDHNPFLTPVSYKPEF